MIITKEFSWDYGSCVQKTYRVEGVYTTPPNNGQTFFVNVVGCDVEDVCKKLKGRNFVHPIRSIKMFNQPTSFKNPLHDPTQDPYYLFDVTPTESLCEECCDFLGASSSFAFSLPDDGLEDIPQQSFTEVTVSCSPNPVPIGLEMRHNFSRIYALNRFLLASKLELPGDVDNPDVDKVSLQYSPKYGNWQGNLHLRGKSSYGGEETWDFGFDFGCVNEFWKFSSLLKRRAGGRVEIVRFVIFFPELTVCAKGRLDGFAFRFNYKKTTSDPDNTQVVFHDEAGLCLSSPDMTELFFNITVAGTRPMTFDHLLEEQRAATIHVADKSGYSNK